MGLDGVLVGLDGVLVRQEKSSWEKRKFYSQIKKIYLVVDDSLTRR